jgi:hypothetical protein
MFNFFKKTKTLPPFETLAGFPQKDHYFIRTAAWRPFDSKKIAVVDPHQPRMITMDPWPQIVFLAADGQKTVAEFIFDMADKYTGAIPGHLDKTVIDELMKLVEKYRIVQFSEQRKRPEESYDKASSR